MDNKFIGLVLGLVVGVLMIGSLLVPTITNASKTEDTFDNSEYGYYQMKPLENGDNWVHNNNQWTYGDALLTTSENTGISVVATNNTVVRQDGIVRGTTYGGNATSTAEVFVVDDANTLQINTTRNISFIDGFGAVPEGGDYIIKKYDTAVYVNGDTPLWVTGYTALGDESITQVMVHITGSIDGGLTISLAPKSQGNTSNLSVVGDYTINYVKVDSHKDLYQLSNVKFTVEGTIGEAEESVTKEFTYSTFVVPKEVTAELANHLDAGEIAMIAVIPVLMIASLLIFAVRFVTRD